MPPKRIGEISTSTEGSVVGMNGVPLGGVGGIPLGGGVVVSNLPGGTLLSDRTVEVGERYFVRWRNGQQQVGEVLATRPARRQTTGGGLLDLSADPLLISPQTVIDGSATEYYVHYQSFDRRMDEWVSLDRVLFPKLPPMAAEPINSAGGLRTGKEYLNLENGPALKKAALTWTVDGIEQAIDSELDEDYSKLTANEISERILASQRADLSSVRVKNIGSVLFDGHLMEAWYHSPLPQPLWGADCLLVCHRCMLYCRDASSFQTHLEVCQGVSTGKSDSEGESKSSPPGRLIYSEDPLLDTTGNIIHDELVVYEVDGDGPHRLWCQCLALVGKLFVDRQPSPLLTASVSTFLVLYRRTAEGEHRLLGFVTRPKEAEIVSHTLSQTSSQPKEGNDLSSDSIVKQEQSATEQSSLNNNLAKTPFLIKRITSIVIFPPYQRRGYGTLLVSLVYELATREGICTSPLKPLGDLGGHCFRSFWTAALLSAMCRQGIKCHDSIEDIAALTDCSASVMLNCTAMAGQPIILPIADDKPRVNGGGGSLCPEDVLLTLHHLQMIRGFKGEYVIVHNAQHVEQYFSQLRPLRIINPTRLLWESKLEPVHVTDVKQDVVNTNSIDTMDVVQDVSENATSIELPEPNMELLKESVSDEESSKSVETDLKLVQESLPEEKQSEILETAVDKVIDKVMETETFIVTDTNTNVANVLSEPAVIDAEELLPIDIPLGQIMEPPADGTGSDLSIP